VLDTPELFWSEASLVKLYEAVRDYMDIEERVENVNEKLSVTSDFVGFSIPFKSPPITKRLHSAGRYPRSCQQ
jgi:uncharacterized Rmd1/YagE family protein